LVLSFLLLFHLCADLGFLHLPVAGSESHKSFLSRSWVWIWIFLPWRVFFPTCDSGEAIFLLGITGLGCLDIQRTVSEEVAMFMAFPAAERDVFIVQHLLPVLVLIFQSYRSQESLRDVHIYADSGI
jgi:hypothetical protein